MLRGASITYNLDMRTTIYIVITLILIACPAYSQDKLTDEQILKLYESLRVADVSDGMDMVGLRDAGLMDQKIMALWKDTDSMKTYFPWYRCYCPVHSHE